MIDTPIPPSVRYSVDAASATTLMAIFTDYLTPILATLGAFLVVVWYTVQIYESSTIQHWLRDRAMRRSGRKLARLKSQQTVLEAEITAAQKVSAARTEARELTATAHAEAVSVEAGTAVPKP